MGVYAFSSLLVLVVDVFVDLVEGALVVQQMVMVVDVGTDSAADDDARGAVKIR